MKFEDNLKRLETLVARMKSGEMKFDEMIAAFEAGRSLVQECRRDLEGIRLKIEAVTADGPRPVETATNENGQEDIVL